MKKQRQRRQHRHPSRDRAPTAPIAPAFTPVAVRARHDGWTPARQLAFVQALAGCACIEEACAAVGMSPRAYYDLRARPDAGSFRQAVDLSLDVGVHRLADAMLGRAIHGESTPVFYRGEQVGERRRYDNRLGMFLLQVRAPERYGAWRRQMQQTRDHPDGAALQFAQAVRALAQDGQADAENRPRPPRAPLTTVRLMDDPAEIAAEEERRERRAAAAERIEEARNDAAFEAYCDTLYRQTGGPAPAGAAPDPYRAVPEVPAPIPDD